MFGKKPYRKTVRKTKLIFFSPGDIYYWSLITAQIFLLSSNFLQRQYEKMYNFFNGNNFLIIIIGYPIVVFVTYWFIGLWFTLIDVTGKPAFLQRYKHQPTKNAPLPYSQLKNCIRTVLFNQFLVIPFAVVNYAIIVNLGLTVKFDPEEWPSFSTVIVDLLVNSTVLEIMFYYNHRILHHPLLYKYIHKKHHEWTAPIAISFFYTHPVEHVFGILFPFIIGVYIRRAHIASAWVWTVVAIAIGMNEHSGYHFPLMASNQFHEFHHSNFNQNYGLVGLMDRIHKTDTIFRKSIACKRNFSFWSLKPQSETIAENIPTENEKNSTCLHDGLYENICTNKKG